MSGYEQTALILSEMPYEQGIAGFVEVFEHLVEYYRLTPELAGNVARLEFGPSHEWVRTLSVDDGDRSLAELLKKYRWLRINGRIPIDRKPHGFELYYYPVSVSGDRVGLLLRLEATAYRAVYGGLPPYHGLFNSEARGGLIALCLGVSDAYRADGFVFDFDPGELVHLSVEGLTQMLLHPVLETPGKGPGLISGIRKDLVSRPDLESMWRPENIVETTTGYLFLALMRPEEPPSV